MESQVRYQFADLEHLLSTEAIPDLQLEQEVLSIKHRLAASIFEMVDELQVRHYVRFHEYALVRLMDRIHSAPVRKINSSGYHKLEELLEFLASDFKDVYDFDAKAPESQIKTARRGAKKHLSKLTEYLEERKVDRALIEASLHGLSRLENEYATLSVTFRRILFAGELQQMIYNLVNDSQLNIEEQLHSMLFYLNCNSIKVFLYETQLVEKQLGGDTNTERISKLALALKKVNQIQVKPGIGYNVHGTSLKDLVSSYLNEEITYLERVSVSIATSPQHDKLIQDFKLKVNLSVAQVAYVFRIFIENQLIQTKNQTELLKFLARVVTTKKAESVSFDSLRAKFYNVETGTKESVRDALSSLVRYVDKN